MLIAEEFTQDETEAQPILSTLAAAERPASQEKQSDSLFRAKFEGDRVAGSGEVVDGVYRFAATKTDGEAWHVKLESNYPTVSGRDYRVTYRFHSNVRGKVKFGDFQEFEIQPGENTVTGMLIASSGTSYLDLQLGMLPPFSIDFRSVEVEEYADEVEYEDALSVPVNFEKEKIVYERHDQGYAPIPTREKDGISLYYFATAWDTGVWKSRLYVKTSLVPEAGVHYRITADMSCDQDMPFEVLFNNGDEEKGYGALYGQSLTAGETKQVEAVIIGSGGGDSLVLQFSLGEAPEESTVKINNVHVEKIRDRYTSMLSTGFALNRVVETGKILHGAIPTNFKPLALGNFSYSGTDTVFTGADDGYVVSLEEGADSATMRISQAPASDRGVWKAKLYAATGVTLQAGTTYRIKYDLQSEKDQAEYEVCFDGSTENAYGALYGRSLTAGGTDSVEYYVTPDASHGPLTLRLQLGKTDTTEGNTVTLSNLSVEAVTPQVQELGTVALSTGSAGNTWEEHADGVEQTLATSGGTATLNVSAARSEGGVWSSKLFIRTGVTPEAGARYRVSATVAATGDTGEFEFLYQNTGASELYGGQWGLSGAGDYSSDFTAPSDGCGELVLLFQLGNSAAGNTVTVSNLQVRRLSGSTEQAVELSGFAYPVAGVEAVAFNSFDLECSNGAAAVLTGNGSSASATVTTPGDDWHVKLYAKTGMELQSGKTYTVTMNVTGAEGCTACYKNTATGAEDGFGTEAISPSTVTHTVTPTESGTLEILLKIGDVAPGTVVTVSNIQIGENTGSSVDITPSGFGYPVAEEGSAAYNSFDLECNSGAVASLGGDGSSATATVTTPGADWNVKLYAKTGVTLEAGKTYQITMNVTGAGGWNVCYKRVGGGENDFDGSLTFGETVTNTVTPSESGTLEILLKLGAIEANGSVTVSNIHIYEVTSSDGNITLTGFNYPVSTAGSAEYNSFALEANSGAAAILTGNGSSATATVTTPGADWNVKLYAKTGLTLEAGKTYRITMNVTGAGGWNVCYKRAEGGENDFDGTLSFGETVTNTVTPTQSGTLEILLKLGAIEANGSVTVSNIQIYEVTETSTDKTPASINYWLDPPAEGAEASQFGNSVTVINPTPSDDWTIKFYVQPGLALETGKRYRVSFDVTNAYGCQVCFKNLADGDETGYGEHWLSANSETVTKYIDGTGGKLEIMLKLGKLPAVTDVTVNNVRIAEVEAGYSAVTPTGFGYPVVTAESTADNSFELETNSGAVATLSGDGSSAAATVTTPGDDWHVKLYAKPGVELQASKTYTISMNVTGADGCTACYKNTATGAEDGFGTETIGSGTVTHTVTPSENGTMEILLKIGNVPANTVVTVSNIQIQIAENASSYDNITLAGFGYPVVKAASTADNSFELEANSGAAASLTGNGSSATATVTTPGADWNVKLYAKTGVTLEAGKTYQITMNVTGAGGWNVCYKRAGGGENDFDGSLTFGETVTNTVTPSESGTLEILLKLGAIEANGSVTVSNIRIVEYSSSYDNVTPYIGYPAIETGSVAYNAFDLDCNSGAAASLTGNGSSATATVTVPGDDWHIKLYAKTGVTLEAGTTYRIDAKVSGADGWKINYKREGGEETDFDGSVTFGETVSNTVTPTESGKLEILLKLGDIAAGGSVTVSDISITRLGEQTPGDNLMGGSLTTATPGSVSFWAHEDYAAALSGDGSSASLVINSAPAEGREAWKVKLFVETGITLNAGKRYRISADVSASAETNYEICYNNGAEEKGVGALYGLHAAPASQTAVYEAAPGSDANLVLQFNLGWAASPDTVTVRNVKVEELSYAAGEAVLPSFHYDSVGYLNAAADAGYVTSLNQSANSATLRIQHAPDERNPWNVKLNVRTGFTPAAQKGYRVSFDIDAIGQQGLFEVFYDGNTEAAYGALYGQSLSAGKKTVSYTIMPGDSRGELSVQIRLGKTDGSNGNAYTISNLKIEEVSFRYTQTLETKDAASLQIQNGYQAKLERKADTATLKIDKTPTEGREPWKSKLFVVPGTTLRAGQKYRISMDVKSIIPAPFEICFNNGSEEKGLGAMFGLMATPSGQHIEYVTYPRQDTLLELQLSLGNCAAPNSIIVSGVKVERAGAVNMVSDTVYTF